MSKRVLIIGLGRFGTSVAKELHHSKDEIVAVDVNEQTLHEIDEFVHYTVLGDAKEDSILDDLDVNNFDSVVVAIGDDFESCVLITKKLKDRNCKNIIAKANDHNRGEILEAVGADEVIYPEEDAGRRLAKEISLSGIIEYVELNKSVSGIEMEVPSEFHGKSLSELNFNTKYGLTVALIMRNNEPLLTHIGYESFNPGDNILVIGSNKKLTKFKEKFE